MIKRTVKETIKKYDEEGRLTEEWVTETTEDEYPDVPLQRPYVNLTADQYLYTTTASANEAYINQDVER